MPWSKEAIERQLRLRIRGFTDDDFRAADLEARIGVSFVPPLSADEQKLFEECWTQIIEPRLKEAAIYRERTE